MKWLILYEGITPFWKGLPNAHRVKCMCQIVKHFNIRYICVYLQHYRSACWNYASVFVSLEKIICIVFSCVCVFVSNIRTLNLKSLSLENIFCDEIKFYEFNLLFNRFFGKSDDFIDVPYFYDNLFACVMKNLMNLVSTIQQCFYLLCIRIKSRIL